MDLCYYVVVRDQKRKRRGSLGSTGTAEIIKWPETMPPSVALLLTFVFVTAPARKITAYRDAKEKTCYLQSIASSNNKQYLELYKNVLYGKRETRKIPKTFYTVPGSLSKSQVLHLAGARVASYCRGFTTMILLPGPPQSMTNDFPDSAESPPSEPSLPRYLKEQMQKRRQKRNAKGKRRYQGQTQVQTIALGGDQLNTAESLAQKNTSQTKLSTTRGMSQAQSQSIYEEDCDGCGDRQSNRNGYSWGQIYDQSGQDARVGFRPNEMHTPGRGIHLPNRRPSGQGYDHDKPSGTGLKPGELYRPDGHKFGPDGKPAQPWDISRPIDGGIRSGFIHGPGGQNYGTDGRPIIQQTPIGGGVRPAIGSNNRPVGQAGVTQQNHESGLRTGGNNEPGRQIYGPGGRHIGQGEATGPTDDNKFRPRESYGQGSYGTDGIPVSPTIQEPFGPGPGGLYRPGQIDGSDRRPNGQRGEATDNLGSGLKEGDINGQDGQIYRKGGIIYQPDRGPISQGRGTYSPGLSPGPGGRIHGTDGRPSSPDIRQGQPQITDVGEIRPGESYRPGGPYFNPSGNLVGLGEQRGPTGTELGPTRPYDQHKVDSNYKPICYWHCAPGATTPPIFPGSSNIQPGGQVYSPAGRPIQPVVNGVRPGETYRPGGQTYGPDGRPIPPGTGGLQTGGQIYGPGGQSYGPDGRPILTGLRPGETHGPGGQSYGPDGRPILTGLRPGETHGPGAQSYGPDSRPIPTGLQPGETYGPGGQIYGPNGRPISTGTGGLRPGEIYGPGGQSYGPDVRPISTGLRPEETYEPGGQIYGPGGQSYGPDGRPIQTGLRPGETYGPGGHIYGPNGRPISTGTGGLRPGETHAPGGQSYGPDGRPIQTGLQPGGTHGPGGQIYDPDGRPTSTGTGGLRPGETLGPGGQSYGPDGRPIQTGLQPGGTHSPGGQIYGLDGRPTPTGLRPGATYGPGGQSYGPDGRPTSTGTGGLQPGGSYGPGGQSYGPDGRPIPTGLRPGETYGPGGQIYGPGGQSYVPDGRPIPTGLRPGETYGPGGQIYGPDGRPISSGTGGLRPGETYGPGGQIYGPGGQSYGPDGRPIQTGMRPGETHGPGGQSYGTDGGPIQTGMRPGKTHGPGGQSYGSDGRPIPTGLRPGETYGPGGQIYGPGGQNYGPDGKPISTGPGGTRPGETYNPSGQSYGPDGRPIQTGLRPGETYGPGGQIYGPDGRPISIGTGELQPGGTYSPGGQGYGPDGRPIPTVGLRPAGEVIGSSGPIYGPDGRPITPGSGGMFGPGGQAYGPVSLTSNNGNGAQQYSPEDLGENDGHSQVKTSISQQNNETIASSSSQGSYGGGKTQTSVSGSYKGSGSFSAQAQTIDTKRGAQSQVVGGDDGASSSAQAFGGKGQSQSQVSLSPETGLTSANSQTTGSGYSTQSEIHASETGGNSVAQATGVGKTSSQAQVKFKPYQNGRESDSQRIPFLGSGSASAQTGPRTGISQSEIFGSFKYGISYTGAAQASSGSKVDREKDGLAPFKDLVFNSTDVKLNTTYVAKPAEQSPVQTEETVSTTQKYDEDYVSSVEDDDDDEDIAPTGVPQTAQTLDRGDQPSTHLNTNEDLVTAQSQHGNPQLYPYVTQVDLPPDALESGYLRQRQEDKISHIRPQSAFSMNNFKQEQYQSSFNQQPYQRQVVTVGKPTNTIARAPNSQRKGNYGNPAQSQSVILGDISNMGVRVMQDADGIGLSSGDVYKSGQPVPGKSGYQIPPGFRGRVVGVNGDYAQASNNQGGQAQTQTVILTPGPGKYEYKGPDNRKSADADYDEYGPEDDSDEEQDTHPPNSNHQNYGRAFQAPPASFVSVTQKVSSQAPYSPPKEFEHTYFTKASKCGYTTYSCQLIDGSNGRAKVCKPKVTKNGNCE